MRSLFVMDPLDRLSLGGDSTYMLLRASTQRGWPCWWTTPQDLYAEGGQAKARVRSVVTGDAPVRTAASVFLQGEPEDLPLASFDLVWMRKDPPFDMAYIFATYLLDMAGPATTVLNDPTSIRSHNEKLFASTYPDLHPPTLLSREAARIVRFAREHERVVLKPWDGNGGRGVVVTHGADPNLQALIELLTDEGRRACICQRYAPEIRQGDKRILLVDGAPVGAMLRVPGPQDHRGNMHVGATVSACELSPRDREICDRIGPALRAKGLLFVGIDVIGPWLTEINVTSPTGIQEINRLYGLAVEEGVLDAARALHEARTGG